MGLDVSWVQLPRNYNFFKRLPSQFLMKVLSAGNSIEKGQWFKVEINSQILNILSQSKLNAGSAYQVKKQNDFKLSIVKQLHSNQLAGSKQALGQVSDKPATNVFALADIDQFSDVINELKLTELISLIIFNETKAEVDLSDKQEIINFKFPIMIAGTFEKFKGCFITREKTWDVLLSLGENPERVLEKLNTTRDEITQQLKQTLTSLPVQNISITNDHHIDSLGKGLDLFT